jgi:type II secretory pathway component PulM
MTPESPQEVSPTERYILIGLGLFFVYFLILAFTSPEQTRLRERQEQCGHVGLSYNEVNDECVKNDRP